MKQIWGKGYMIHSGRNKKRHSTVKLSHYRPLGLLDVEVPRISGHSAHVGDNVVRYQPRRHSWY